MAQDSNQPLSAKPSRQQDIILRNLESKTKEVKSLSAVSVCVSVVSGVGFRNDGYKAERALARALHRRKPGATSAPTA